MIPLRLVRVAPYFLNPLCRVGVALFRGSLTRGARKIFHHPNLELGRSLLVQTDPKISERHVVLSLKQFHLHSVETYGSSPVVFSCSHLKRLDRSEILRGGMRHPYIMGWVQHG